MLWYKLASADINITGPHEGIEHLTDAREYLQYRIFTAVDSKTNKNIGYILFQTPKDKKFIKEFLRKNPSFDHKYLWNSYTLQVTVAPEYRKQGIATRLYKKVDEYLQEHNKPELKFFEYSHLSPGAQHIWNKRMQRKTSAAKDFSYFSIGHSRNYSNIILWIHDGKQLYSKISTPEKKTHLSAFSGINWLASGRIELDKKISSFAIDLPKEISMMQQNHLRKKIIDDLKNAFPDIKLIEHGQIIEAHSKSYFKLAQFGAGYGEHWIDDSGNLLYADGDIGSMGHEAHVIEIARSQIAGYEYARDEFTDWDRFLEDVAQEILDAANSNPQFKLAVENRIGEPLDQISWQDMVNHDYVETELVKKRGINKDLFDLAMDRTDARLYGMQVWGWKRVMNNYVETWQLTKGDCDIIASGLSEIVPEDDVGKTKWTIEVRSNGKYFPNIPLFVIEQGPKAVWEHSRSQND